MNAYIKPFENGGKNMPFIIKNDDVCWTNAIKLGARLERH